VFALGATLAFAATGRPPFGDGAFPAVAYRTVHGDIDVEGVEPGLAAIIIACTDRDRARRPTPGRIVELCQSRTSLANDPTYQRFATPATTSSAPVGAPVLVPTVADASEAAAAAQPHQIPTVLAVPLPVPTEAWPTDASPALDDEGGRPGTRQPAGTALDLSTSGGARRHGLRRGTVLTVTAVAGVGALAAALWVLQPWQSEKGSAGRSGTEASATATEEAADNNADTDAQPDATA
jgi:hypothetical protein